ncbi:MAG TPA: ABC transporter permease [Sulfurospirillum arcachonense]|nr:ABC transporter permease [Sulfurospirillum arcachonense]
MINAFRLELIEIKNSFYLFSLLTWIPLVSFLLIISIFNEGVVRDLPISVVDHDNSKLSRQIITQINTNSTLHVKGLQADLKQASIDIVSSNIYATVVIPKHFEKDVLQKKQPQITAFINTQYLLIGKMINSALSSTIQQSSARVDFVSNLRKDGQFSTAGNLASPIGIQVTPFFNTYQNYFLFLVSAIIPTLLQILIALAIIASMSRTFKAKKEKEFFKNGIISALIGKTLPYTLAFFGWGVMFLLYMYGYETWEFQGSFGVTFLALLLMILAYEGVALFFFVISFDYVRALSLAALYTAPAFAFLGITFPVSSMPEFALVWHNLLPISHYLKIQISQASYGAPVSEVVPLLLNLIWFLPMWIFVIIRLRKKI